MSKKDLAILGFESNFDYTTNMVIIIKRFKKLALEYHPDKRSGNEDKFKMVENAYHNIMSRIIQQKGKEIEKEEGEDSEYGEHGEHGEDGVKIGHTSKSDVMKRCSYDLHIVYFNRDNYFKHYGVADENTYKPFVLFFNIHVALYLKSKNVGFEHVKKIKTDGSNESNGSDSELLSYGYLYESLVEKWNLLSRRKKRIYRGIVRTIDIISNEPVQTPV